jgi:hypothetical protein
MKKSSRKQVVRVSKLNSKTPICFLAGLLLLCLTLISTHMTSGLYAKYITFADGSDNARVAEFSISQSLQITKGDNTPAETFIIGDDLYPGKRTTYTYSVTNNSEVAVEFIVSGRELLGDLPLVIRSGETSVELVAQAKDCASLMLSPKQSGVLTFYVEWPETQNDISFVGMISQIEITVRAEQKD